MTPDRAKKYLVYLATLSAAAGTAQVVGPMANAGAAVPAKATVSQQAKAALAHGAASVTPQGLCDQWGDSWGESWGNSWGESCGSGPTSAVNSAQSFNSILNQV
jgi:hypothetical protein